LIWDRPVQLALNLNFIVPRGEPLFGVGQGILDDWNLFVRIFAQSGKRYTPQTMLGYEAGTGRPVYVSDLSRELEGIGEDWFIVNLNLEKFVDLGFGVLSLGLQIDNLLDRRNTQIVNPVTGRAYEYGDATPIGYNDPLFPQLSGDISPFPYNPARYLAPRNILFSVGLQF